MPKKKDIWKQIIKTLQSHHQERHIHAWFSGTELEFLDSRNAIIKVPNRFVAIWLRDHFLSNLTSAFKQVCGYAPTISYSYASSPNPFINTSTSAFHPEFTFDTFIVDSLNRFAHAAALSVAEKPLSNKLSPLVIFAKFPSGKTHLLHAIGNYIRFNSPDATVGYISTKDFISAVHQTDPEPFCNLDILLMDDIHHMAGHMKAQLALLNIADNFLSRNKPFVFTCTEPPGCIPNLDQHLGSRLQSGILAEITGVEEKTRVAIVRRKLAKHMVKLPEDIILYLINLTDDLSGLLKLTEAIVKHKANKGALELSDIAGLTVAKDQPVIDMEQVLDSVAGFYGISRAELTSPSKQRRICRCRHIAMYLCKEILGIPIKDITELMGKLSHSSILYGVKRIQKDINTNRQTLKEIQELKKIITYC